MGQCRTLDALGVVMVVTVHVATQFLHPFLFGTNIFSSHFHYVKRQKCLLWNLHIVWFNIIEL